MPPVPLEYAPKPSFDTGRFTARYLQILATLSVAWMLVGPIFTHRFNLDLSFVFLLWAASALRRHSRLARVWVIIVCAFGVFLCAAVVAQAAMYGTAHITVNFIRPIHNPATWQVTVVSAIVAALAGVPLYVLLSATARKQFGRRSDGE